MENMCQNESNSGPENSEETKYELKKRMDHEESMCGIIGMAQVRMVEIYEVFFSSCSGV